MFRFNLTMLSGTVSLVALLTTTAFSQGTKLGGAQSGGGTPASSSHQSSTLKNLQTAFYAESDASALYSQYAKKADEEGYAQLGSVFRAIARGEQIHAANCAALIRQMGETPKTIDEPLIVLSTVENLAGADATQLYENDVMYPEFIKQARSEKNDAAAKVFSHNLAAEPAHHALLQQARKHMEQYKGEHVKYLVCASCGYAALSLESAACPTCSMPKEQFEQVE